MSEPTTPDRARWNAKHAAAGQMLPSIPLLTLQARLAPGLALDLAGGRGENAAVLSLAGWKVVLADLSEEALARAGRRSAELKADVHRVQADALRLPFCGPFDLIVAANFLERGIAPELERLLAPGGTLFCEQPLSGAYAIRPGEIRQLFPSLETLVLNEEGERAVYLGRKP